MRRLVRQVFDMGKRGKRFTWLGWVCKGWRVFFAWRALPTRTTLEPGVCLAAMGLPIVVGLWASAAVSSVPAADRVDPLARLLRLVGLPLGASFGLALVVLLLVWLARSHPNVTWHRRHGSLIVLLFTVTIYGVYLIPWTRDYLAASICICLLLALIALVLFVTSDNGLVRILTVAILIGLAGLTNSSDFKLKYPLLEPYYSNPLSIRYDQEVGADREPELLADGGTDQSVDYFDKFLEMYPHGTAGIIGRRRLARVEWKNGRGMGCHRFPDRTPRPGFLDVTLHARNHRDRTRAVCTGAERLRSSNLTWSERSIAHFGRGLALMGLAGYEDAVISLDTAVTADPHSEAARLAYAVALLRTNKRACEDQPDQGRKRHVHQNRDDQERHRP